MSKTLDELTGAQRASVVLLSVDSERAKSITKHLDEEEVREIAQSMAGLGAITPEVVESILREFTGRATGQAGVTGSLKTTEDFLRGNLDPDYAEEILGELSGPEGKTIWQKLSNATEQELSSFLINEHPQTMALVLANIESAKAGRVMQMLPEVRAQEVAQRIYNMGSIDRRYRRHVESALSRQFFGRGVAKTGQSDNAQTLAKILNRTAPKRVDSILGYFETEDDRAAKRIRANMFTFEDLLNLDGAALRMVIGRCDQEDIAKALANADDETRDRFYENMTERGARALRNFIEDQGKVRKRDVEQARMVIVEKARELESEGEITLKNEEDEDEDELYGTDS